MRSPVFTRREVVAGASLVLAVPVQSQTIDPYDPPPPGRLNFLVLGDWGRKGHAFQKHVAGWMGFEGKRIGSRFVVTTGDNFYTCGVSGPHDEHWSASFDGIYVHPSLNTLWYPTLGNHDYGGSVQAQLERTDDCRRWCMPKKWRKLGVTEHGHPDVDLFLIDTIVWNGSEGFPFNLFGDSIGPGEQQEQRDWLERELIRSTARIKLVFGHYPIYSVGPHGGKMEMWELDQLLRRANVTAYICGHDHCLYHITCDGMHYICSGGGSQELRKFTGDRTIYGCVLRGQCQDSPAEQLRRPVWNSFADRAGFASFSVGANDLEFRLIDRAGVIFHRQTIAAPAAQIAHA